MPEIQEEEIDLREYINVLLKRKGVIILLIFLIAVITAALVSYFYLKPVYEASTILMISKPKYQVELEPKIQTQFTPEVSLATYESLIKDRKIEEEAIKKLNLDQPPYEFTPDSLQGMITIESLKNTNLIKMNLQAGEPKLAKDIANVWASLFIEKNKDLNLQESKEAQGFIEEQLKISNQNLSTIEEEIREFNETNNIDAMDKEITVKLDKIMANESRLADVKISTESEKAKIEEIRSQMISQEKLISSSNIDRLTEGMKFTEAKDFIESQLVISNQNLSKIEEEIREFNETNNIVAMDKEISEKLNKIMGNESRLADIKTATKKEEANIWRIFQQLLQKRIECYQSRKADLELSIFKEKINLSQIQKQLDEQDKIITLSKSIVEDQFYKQLIEKISESDSIALNELKLNSEELNPLFIGLQNKLDNSALSLQNKEAESQKLIEIISFLNIELEEVNLSQDEQDQDIEIGNLIKLIDKTLFEISKVDVSSFEDSISRNLKQKLVDGIILIKSLNAEMFQLKENIDDYWERIRKLKQELAQEKLAQSRLERDKKVLENTYIMLDNKMKEIEIATATPENQQKIARFTNPEYLSLQKQLIESTIMQKTLQAEEKQLKENVNNAWKRVDALKQELAQEKLAQSRLEREYNTAKGVFGVLSQKNEEVKIAVATESGLVKIASLAYEPKYPIKPNKKLNILIAGVLGLFVGIFVAFFLEFWQKGKS
jgi:uncharacterized protein involved in exopolysaccharide biosynthesis